MRFKSQIPPIHLDPNRPDPLHPYLKTFNELSRPMRIKSSLAYLICIAIIFICQNIYIYLMFVYICRFMGTLWLSSDYFNCSSSPTESAICIGLLGLGWRSCVLGHRSPRHILLLQPPISSAGTSCTTWSSPSSI